MGTLSYRVGEVGVEGCKPVGRTSEIERGEDFLLLDFRIRAGEKEGSSASYLLLSGMA